MQEQREENYRNERFHRTTYGQYCTSCSKHEVIMDWTDKGKEAAHENLDGIHPNPNYMMPLPPLQHGPIPRINPYGIDPRFPVDREARLDVEDFHSELDPKISLDWIRYRVSETFIELPCLMREDFTLLKQS